MRSAKVYCKMLMFDSNSMKLGRIKFLFMYHLHLARRIANCCFLAYRVLQAEMNAGS